MTFLVDGGHPTLKQVLPHALSDWKFDWVFACEASGA
jgi:hypothetical protein